MATRSTGPGLSPTSALCPAFTILRDPFIHSFNPSHWEVVMGLALWTWIQILLLPPLQLISLHTLSRSQGLSLPICKWRQL
jgi:hypothetical protein